MMANMKIFLAVLSCVLAVCPLTVYGEDKPAGAKLSVQVLKTPSGERFGMLGKKGSGPAPTLFVFATGLEESLQSADFNRVGHLLGQKGFLCVSVDVPCHGKDRAAGEPGGLHGWPSRLEKGKPLVEAFAKKSSHVLSYLIEEGYTDEKKVGACGTSRGGFMALHFAAAEPRVGWVIAFAPVTDLTVLSEFAGLEKDRTVRGLSLIHHADKLAGRGLWLCIGNRDRRVGTDHAIALTRRIVEAAKPDKAIIPVELHVTPTAGHTIHATAHEEAARWALSRVASP